MEGKKEQILRKLETAMKGISSASGSIQKDLKQEDAVKRKKDIISELRELQSRMGDYAYLVSIAPLILGRACEMILEREDYPVLEELKSVVAEAFESAASAMRELKGKGGRPC